MGMRTTHQNKGYHIQGGCAMTGNNRVYVTGSLLRRLKRDRDALGDIIRCVDDGTHRHTPSDVVLGNIKAILRRRRETR